MIINKEYKGKYIQEKSSGAFHPENFNLNFTKYFSLV
jgi:hypothetical protein